MVLGHNRLRRFRTPPAEDARRAFQFALFSCHMPYQVSGLFRKRTDLANLDMWDFLGRSLRRHEDEVDLVIAGGDQCYTDGGPDPRHLEEAEPRHAPRRGAPPSGRGLAPDLVPRHLPGLLGFRGSTSGVRQLPYLHDVGRPRDRGRLGLALPRGWRPGRRTRTRVPRPGRARPQPRRRPRTGAADVPRGERDLSGVSAQPQPRATAEGVWDYSFERGGAAFYALDGRGHRDVERDSFRILGRPQFDRFARWAESLDPEDTPFLFVVSAVPVLHARAALVAADQRLPLREAGLGDDLRDAWEHELHDEERRALMQVLFEAAARGFRVAILSGDVHVSAAFAIHDSAGNRIWQLTSSAITYNIPRPLSWILRLGAADEGETGDGHRFERHALYADSSYAMVNVSPRSGEAWFRLYGAQRIKAPSGGGDAVPLGHSVARIRLF